MTYQVLALKWRPQGFEEVVGQSHVTRTLQNAIRSARVPHAFLFTGSRGVGKTTTARILAKALVCEQGPTPEPCNTCRFCLEVTGGRSLDVLEIDGASNRGIDEIRELRENVRYAPSAARFKIYVIDEVHMLTKEAFNALLKTLEEPPAHVKFIFATTENNKVPITIQSRCQRFDFRLLSQEEILEQLAMIAEKEGVEISRAALATIAGAAEGSLRDGESLMDQVLAFSGKNVADSEVHQALGLPEEKTILEFLTGLVERQGETCLRILDKVTGIGLDPRSFTREVLTGLRHLAVLKAAPQLADMVAFSQDGLTVLQTLSAEASPGRLQSLFEIFLRAEAEIRSASFPRMLLELAVVRAIRLEEVQELQELLRRLEGMEKKILESPTPPDAKRDKGPVPATAPAEEENNGPVDVVETAESAETASGPDEIETESAEVRPPAADPGREETFRNMIRRIRKEGVVLASFLEHGSLTAISSAEVIIAFDPADTFFVDTLRERDNLALLRQAAREVLGRRVEVKLVLLGTGEEVTKNEEKLRESDLKKKRRKEALEHPAVLDALSVFQAQVIDVKLLE